MADVDSQAAGGLTADQGAALGKIAIEHESTAAASPAGTVQLAGDRPPGERRLDGGQAVLTRGRARRRERAAARDDVDRAAERVGAVDRGPGPVDDFDAIDRPDRRRDLAVVMTALAVVQTKPVDEHEALTEGGAANREIRLHVAGPARAWIDSGDEPKTLRSPS